MDLDTPRAAAEEEEDLPVGSPRRLRRLREAFDRADYGRSGEMETKELRGVMRAVGQVPTPQPQSP